MGATMGGHVRQELLMSRDGKRMAEPRAKQARRMVFPRREGSLVERKKKPWPGECARRREKTRNPAKKYLRRVGRKH